MGAVATGITAEGGREILGADIGDSKDATFWTAFLRSLKKRGLGGVRLVDGCRRDEIGAQIARGYRERPQSDAEVAWADESSLRMIAEEPW